MFGLIVLLAVVAATVLLLVVLARRDRVSRGVDWFGGALETGGSDGAGHPNLPPEVGRQIRYE
jgi:hypothetical protein